MLSLTELRRAARIVGAGLAGARLERVVQPDDFRCVLVFRAPSNMSPILLSCRPEFGRVCMADGIPRALPVPPSFAQFMRAHLIHSTLTEATASSRDRQMALLLSSRDASFELILSLLGARSNLYLLDSAGRLVHSLRPLETTRSELRLGEPWKEVEGSLRNAGVDRWEDIPDDQYLEKIDKEYRILENRREAETLTRRIETALTREEEFVGRKLANLTRDLAEARQAEDLKRKGELLKGALYAIRPGDGSIEANDHETGERVEIPLRSDLTPAENLELYFARYHKQSRGMVAIEAQLAEAQSARSEVESLREQLLEIGKRNDPDLQSLRSLASQPRVRKLISRYYPSRGSRSVPVQAKRAKEVPARLLPKRYQTNQGLQIWVGRSDEGNDHLTTRLARGNDLFFHLEGYPGSHVVLRVEGRTDPPQEAILDACELAVHFSKLKDASRADVHVTRIKNVRKPKGAKPGLVYVLRGKTIHLRRNPKRLRDILATRLDE